VLVGGLGLGYTAQAALGHPEVGSPLNADDRIRYVLDDFFALMRREPEQTFDAILLDVDHSPRHQLNPSHADLYAADGLRRMQRHLSPGGVFALWSDDPPDAEFGAVLAGVFATTHAHVVDFPNPLTGGTSSNTVYVAH
jgi:spermidine synthase